MAQFRGTEQLGKYKDIPLTIDWDYLAHDKGFRKEEQVLERAVASLLTVFSVLTALGLLLYDLFFFSEIWNGIFTVDSMPKLLVWLSLGLGLYAAYLLRNRDRFLDTLRSGNLQDLHKRLKSGEQIKSIEITYYLDNDLLLIIDELLDHDNDNFLGRVMLELEKRPNIAEAIKRLGLGHDEYIELFKKLKDSEGLHVDKWIKPMLTEAFLIAFTHNFDKVGEFSFFVFCCAHPLSKVLLARGVHEEEILALLTWMQNKLEQKRYLQRFKFKSAANPFLSVNRAFTSVKSALLTKYSRDFTNEVVNGDFTLSMARDVELEEIITNLQEGDASAVLLVGEPGVGKTTVLKSLAVKLLVGEVPKVLANMRLIAFDFNRAYALSPDENKFKRVVEKVLEETVRTGNIILVLDNLEEMVKVRKELAAEVVNLMENAIDKHKLRIVATTTGEGYNRYIKVHKSLAASFQTVELKEPSNEVTVQILFDALPRLEAKHKVSVSFDTLVRIVQLSRKFDFDRVLPDKAFILLEEVMLAAVNSRLTFVSQELVEKHVSRKVGVQVGAISAGESEQLIRLEEKLHSRVIGQDDAVHAVAAALRRSRAGLAGGKRPVASFLFFGPTGVGKTELTKALAAEYFGDEKLMVRLDMSEYQEEENLQRLLGREEGEKFIGGYLTEAIRNKPFSLVLLDEIEKANSKVLDLFLQVLDEGSITDGAGRQVDFTNTIIIATSNVASKDIADQIAAGKRYSEVVAAVTPRLREFLRVEFLNRFDKVIMFKPLTKAEVQQIGELLMKGEQKKLKEQGIDLRFSDKLILELVELGYNPLYGARELRRTIQDQVEDRIATLIIEKKVQSGGAIVMESLEDVKIS